MNSRRCARFLWLFLFLFSARAFPQKYKLSEAQCPNVDLSSRFGALRDQGSTGQCFAFVAADLVGFNQGVVPPDQVSALDVGITYHTIDEKDLYAEAQSLSGDSWDLFKALSFSVIPRVAEKRKKAPFFDLTKSVDEGGFLILALAAYNKKGSYCLESKLRSEAPLVDRERNIFIHNRMRALQSVGFIGMPMSIIPRAPSEQPFYDICRDTPDSLANFKSFSEKFSEQVVTQLRDKVDQECAPRTPMKKMDYEMAGGFQSPDSYLALAAANVLKQGTPVGVAYDSSFLVSGRAAPVKRSDHGSSLVGSRWNATTNTCEFKLRNSWGLNCTVYASEFRESCEKEKGYIWITENDINTRSESVFAIKNQK